MITNLKVQSMANLRHVDTKLGNINLLVGKRGTGKSNFINVLAYMNSIFSNNNHWQSNVSIFCEKDTTILETRVRLTDTIYDYQIRLSDLKISETVSVDFQNVMQTINGIGNIQDINEDNDMKINGDSKQSHLRNAVQYGNKPNITKLCDFIQGWGKYDGEYNSTSIANDAMLLRETDGNSYDYWHSCVQDITGGYPTPVELNGESHLFIVKDNQKIHSSNLSDGEKKLISMKLASVIPQLEDMSVLIFNNPENSLDADGQHRMAHTIGDMSIMDNQIFVETHSDIIVDELNTYDDVNVLYFDDTLSGTTIRTLDYLTKTYKGLDGWISDFGLGSAIFDSNLIIQEDE